jgi:hypothetical protein
VKTLKTLQLIAAPLLSIGLASTACGDGPLTFEDLAGEYTLIRVDGSKPPATISQTADRTEEITAGRLTILAVGEYIMTFELRITVSGEADPIVTDSTIIETGPFTIDDQLLVMRTTTRELTLFGTVSGRAITVGLPWDGRSLLLTFTR